MNENFRILIGDAIAVLPQLAPESVNCCVTSPPYYGLRDYGLAEQIGLERTPDEYVARLVDVFRAVRRVLKDDGTLWLNLGDSYASGGRCTYRSGASDNKGHLVQNDMPRPDTPAGLKPKDLIGIPWRVAFALQAAGWYLRSDIIWHKPNPMPESVKDRPTKSHEYLFLLAKSEQYYYDADAIREPFTTNPRENYPDRARVTTRGDQVFAIARGNDRGKSGGFPPASHNDNPLGRNKRSVWTINTLPTPDAHFATYPIELPELCILAGCPEGGVVLDPFSGAGTTGLACLRTARQYLGIELNPDYIQISHDRAHRHYPLLAQELAG